MFKRNRKAAPVIASIETSWIDGRVREIHWADGARVYTDTSGILVEDSWAPTRMTAEHWDSAWTETNRNAVRA